MTQNFDQSLKVFVAGAQAIIDTTHRDNNFSGMPDVLSTSIGQRYVRVIRKHAGMGEDRSGSVHCFVDTTNGDVLKAESWKKPAMHARGNIFDATNGLAKMGPYGPAYLK